VLALGTVRTADTARLPYLINSQARRGVAGEVRRLALRSDQLQVNSGRRATAATRDRPQPSRDIQRV